MAALKTQQNDTSVQDFINASANTEQKRKDSFELLKLMQEFTGYEPKMWGDSSLGLEVIITNLKEAARKEIGRL